MQSMTATADARKIALQFIADCRAGATPALVRHARRVLVDQPRTESAARNTLATAT